MIWAQPAWNIHQYKQQHMVGAFFHIKQTHLQQEPDPLGGRIEPHMKAEFALCAHATLTHAPLRAVWRFIR